MEKQTDKQFEKLKRDYTCKLNIIDSLKEELNFIKDELQFKEDRISDLLVERDKGVWRKGMIKIEDVEKMIDEISDLNFTFPIKKRLKKEVNKLKEKNETILCI